MGEKGEGSTNKQTLAQILVLSINANKITKEIHPRVVVENIYWSFTLSPISQSSIYKGF